MKRNNGKAKNSNIKTEFKGDGTASYHSKYCVAHTRDKFQFWPNGVGIGEKWEIPIDSAHDELLTRSRKHLEDARKCVQHIMSQMDRISKKTHPLSGIVEFYEFLRAVSGTRRLDVGARNKNSRLARPSRRRAMSAGAPSNL